MKKLNGAARTPATVRDANRALFCKRRIFLSPRANLTAMPSKTECEYLKEMGLGETDRYVSLWRRWNTSRMRQYLCLKYPRVPLASVGFDFARCDSRGRITVVDVDSVAALDAVVRSGPLVLIPHRDISLPPAVVQALVKVEPPEDWDLCPVPLKPAEAPETAPSDCTDVLQRTLTAYAACSLPHTTMDMFATFWRAAEHEYFRGEHVLVPFVPVHRLWPAQATFRTLGRILGHMWLCQGTVPWNIARTTYLQLAEPARDLCDTLLLADLLALVTVHERTLLEAALHDFGALSRADVRRLQAFFAAHDVCRPLSTCTFRTQLLSLAAQLLVHAPKQLVLQMRLGFPAEALASFAGAVERGQVAELLAGQRPTVEKVLAVLVPGMAAAAMLGEQRRVWYYLQVYVRSLATDHARLTRFVFFASGSVHMPHLITVVFGAGGVATVQERIEANRCVRTVRLSTAFSTYQEFKRELDGCVSRCYR